MIIKLKQDIYWEDVKQLFICLLKTNIYEIISIIMCHGTVISQIESVLQVSIKYRYFWVIILSCKLNASDTMTLLYISYGISV